jgi:hypothetical protein
VQNGKLVSKYNSCKFGQLNFYHFLIMTIYVHLDSQKLMIFLSLYIENLKYFLHVFIWEKSANMTRVSDMAPGPLGLACVFLSFGTSILPSAQFTFIYMTYDISRHLPCSLTCFGKHNLSHGFKCVVITFKPFI